MAPPRSLPEELVEEILLRFPPDELARLVHVALVCKPWCAIVFGAGFRRRFREFHRTPPLLGFVSMVIMQGGFSEVEFVPTSSLPASQVRSHWSGRVLDAHHGRVLLYYRISDHCTNVLMIWDPITGVQEIVPDPPVTRGPNTWTAAVLCAASGPCDHLVCQSL